MMQSVSRQVESNQIGVHEKLVATVQRHLATSFRKPISAHTQQAFDLVQSQLAGVDRPLILDACCGVGDSSRVLAARYPDHWVIGVDKSEHRLVRERKEATPENLIFVRADLNDFYRLAENAAWRPARHFILYPNPWPKAEHLKRRWHGAPVFPYLVQLGGLLELRSNWRLYLEEFAIALTLMGHQSSLVPYQPEDHITPFERKYALSGQPLWQLIADLGSNQANT